MTKKLLVWFDEVDKEDISLVGGKGANLGEMTRAGFPVPPGFIVTADAYREFIRENNLEIKIQHLLGLADYASEKSMEKVSSQIEHLIQKGNVSPTFVDEVFRAYTKMGEGLVAVRSSATAEDLPTASFAGQQETFLNTKGEANLLLRIKECWASLYHPRALFYRHEHKISEKHVAIAVPVQKMIESDSSGIVFSIDPVTNDKTKIVVEAIYGLGELIVQGEETPDHYEIEKSSLSLLQKSVAEQKYMLIKKGAENKKVNVEKSKKLKQKITDEQILQIAALSKKLEHHYYFPQDSEWAIEKGHVYLVQTRPITTIHSQTNTHSSMPSKEQAFLHGSPASPGLATGSVRILMSAKDIDLLKDGEILVAPQTNPDFVPAMKRASAIVTDTGGRTSHAAIVAREIGIPAVVGAENATQILKNEQIITVNGATGDVYRGSISFSPSHHRVNLPTPTATRIYVNLAEPEFASRVAQRDVDGVGLLRAEFMMAGINVHPKKMIEEGKQQEYIEKLASGIAEFAKTFSPRPVIYRASDFKTNEYRLLPGGKDYEPEEPNPMLGFRGAFRYIHDPEVFDLEIKAIQYVRNKLHFRNVWLMLPFVRTVKELQEVKSLIAAQGLYRSPSFKLWMMVEVPSNVILLDEFIKQGIDGISIGSNDLTMLLLGTDRDNSTIAREYNEQDEAVLWAVERVITTAHKYGITSSFCGQAVSIYPKLLQRLIDLGITSISVSPDAIELTREYVAKFEKERVNRYAKN